MEDPKHSHHYLYTWGEELEWHKNYIYDSNILIAFKTNAQKRVSKIMYDTVTRRQLMAVEMF